MLLLGQVSSPSPPIITPALARILIPACLQELAKPRIVKELGLTEPTRSAPWTRYS